MKPKDQNVQQNQQVSEPLPEQTDIKEQKDSDKPNKKIKKAKQANNHKKRKKWPWILLSVVLILAIGITILVKWQWNNIMAIYYASKYTPEQLQAMQKENEAVMQQICDRVSSVDFSRLPEEAQKMLQTGELTEEDAVSILTGKLQWADVTGDELRQDAVEEGLVESQNPSSVQQISRVDEIIAKMYVLRSGYVGKLDALVSQAWGEYKKGGLSKTDLINKYLGIGYGLEGECDAQMEGLLSELQGELSRTGGDATLISDIRHTYLSQKSMKKAEMIAKYQK